MKRLRERDGEERSEEPETSLASVLMLLSRAHVGEEDEPTAASDRGNPRMFECKTCNRQFPSFQALGGHRASHKRQRATPLNYHHPYDDAGSPATKARMHECSVCGLEFSIGQALGGHMRRHRVTANPNPVEHKATGRDGKGSIERFDLNMPPVEGGDANEDLRLLTFRIGFPSS